jgi:uncharacterized protein with von Willebrand factor type A (vWA) domain
MNPQNEFHFYASSVADWATTDKTRDLPALIKLMEKFGYSYNLFFVPVPADAAYEIKSYEPQVAGAVWLGHFEPKAKK